MNLKKYFFHVTPDHDRVAEWGITLLRVYFGLNMALAHGFGKVPPDQMFVEEVAKLGFPMALCFTWAAALSEFVGGLFLAAGLFTRISGFFVAFTMAVAVFVVHAADPFNIKELGLIYMVVALVFMARGASRYSLDHYLTSRS